MVRTLLLVALGGGIGSAFRYLTSIFANRYFTSPFPLATFLTNIIGCLLIGIFVGFLEKNEAANPDLKWFLITGFCGGYTTFSAFGFENISLFRQQHYATAFLYIGASVIAGLAAVCFGLYMSRQNW